MVMDTTAPITPENLDAAIIQQIQKVGVARRYCRPATMTSSPFNASAIAAPAESNIVDENALILATDATVANAMLTAVKIICRTIYSNELGEDMVDFSALAVSAANSVAALEDSYAFGQLTTDIVSQVTATGSTLEAVTLADFVAAISNVTTLDATAPRFYGSRAAYALAALTVQGSVGVIQNDSGEDVGNLLGYQWQFVPGMAGASATTGDVICLFGYLDAATVFGVRSEPQTRILQEISAANDQSQMISRERIGATIWDTDGNAMTSIALG